MSPRRSAAAARESRANIVQHATTLTSAEGFGAVSLGRLAGVVRMSKAGVIGHFGTMEQLELAVVECAIESFRRNVWDRSAGKRPGLARLTAICDAWLAYVAGRDYVGGCFTSAELSSSPQVREAVAEALRTWRRVLAAEVRTAVDAGEIAAPDPDQVVFELSAFALGAAQALRLGLDRRAVARARNSMRLALRR